MEDEPFVQQPRPKRNIQNQSVDSSNRRVSSLGSDRINHVDVIAGHDIQSDFNGKLALSIAACTLGSSFQFGYNTGIVNAPERVLKGFYNQTYHNRTGKYLNCNEGSLTNCDMLTFLWALTVALYAVGGMCGGFSAGYLANKFGRKRTLLLNNILMVVSVAVEISSKYLKSYEVLMVGRLIIGINAGINTGTAPLYLSEISPVSLRGLCGTFNQLCITLGVLISTVMGLDTVFGTDKLWQYAFGFPLVLVVWQLLTLSLCPESPRFLLIQRGSENEARKALQWLRGRNNVSDEMNEMMSEREAAKHIRKFTILDLFHSPALKAPLIISVVMHLSQQWSGINAVIYYSTSIFESAGLSEKQSQYATLATGAVNTSMTFVSALVMDRLGRRTLHLTGLGGMFIASYILTLGQIYEALPGFLPVLTSIHFKRLTAFPHETAVGEVVSQYYIPHTQWVGYICVMAVIFYIISFATGPGAIPWFFTAELFAQGPRSAAVSIGVLVNWAANATVGISYPFLEKKIGPYSFIPFVVFLSIFWVYTLLQVPETKGKTIDEITALFKTPEVTVAGGYQRLTQEDDSDDGTESKTSTVT